MLRACTMLAGACHPDRNVLGADRRGIVGRDEMQHVARVDGNPRPAHPNPMGRPAHTQAALGACSGFSTAQASCLLTSWLILADGHAGLHHVASCASSSPDSHQVAVRRAPGRLEMLSGMLLMVHICAGSSNAHVPSLADL